MVAFDSVGPSSSGASSTSSSTLSYTHTTVGGPTAIVAGASPDQGSITETVKCDGVLMTAAAPGQINAGTSANGSLEVFSIAGIAAGAHTILVTCSSAPVDITGGSIAFTSAGAIGATASTSADAQTAPSVTVNGTATASIIAGFHSGGDTINSTTAPATSRFNKSLGGAGNATGNTAGATSPGGGNVTVAWATNVSPSACIAVEVTDAPAGGGITQAQPGRTWLRRFHHRQQLPPPPAAAVTTGAAVPPLHGPVRAPYPPLLRGGTVSHRAGVYGQLGPPVKPAPGPVRAKVPLGRGGTVTSRTGIYGQAGPPVKAAEGPVRARVPQPVRGGTVTRRTGIYGQPGPALKSLASAVAGKLRGLPPRGRTAGRTGIYGQPGPPVKPATGPVQARRLPTRGGSATGRAGTFTAVGVVSGPPVYPLGHPVQARRLPLRGGHVSRAAGVYGGTGAPVRPLTSPVKAQPAPARGGHVASRAGALTAGGPQAGPPIYPLAHPVQAKRQPTRGGRVVRRAGVYGQAGPPVKALQQPVGIWRQQPPPPTRGRTGSARGPYAQTGPPVVRLRRPVRGQPAKPLLTGRAAWRAGTYTAPLIAPFTVGALTAGDRPTATQAPTDKATSALTASTAPSSTLTAGDTRTGGPG